MSEKSFIHLLIITFALLIVAIFSILVQPRFETKINKGEVIFQDLNSELNNISRIEIKNGLKEVVIEKNNRMQPILIGTTSVESSEILSKILLNSIFYFHYQ